ncbi:MAG: dTDP-4-dehydrorhamnose reductase [Flavobacteriaceae bacterium TMED48]|jgi:dTDP-4-dehydrorhamnose reductase|nr:MAG: dTDP-4-dehydrorhamnose reductase [Flavobacteriaceae bacterium TMED48]|tara:strand:+ start:1690 stop:2556 length:867 start_codon:yes stop_codon:yes gene_type:complete
MPSYLVTGSKGQLGQCFHSIQSEFPQYQLLFAPQSEVDITQVQTLSNYFKKHPFEGIINCAAYTQVDQAETDTDAARKINSDGVRTLIKFADAKSLKLIHFSTDFVFDGTKKGEYLEDDQATPLSNYGQSKREGEVFLEKANCPSVNFRVSWLYSPFGKNFVKTIIKTCQSKTVLKVVDNQFGKPTNGIDLARAVLSCLKHPDLFKNKTYHFAQGPQTTWFDFARKITQLIGSNCKVEPISSLAYPTAAKRPPNSALNTQRIENTLSLNIRPWESALEECIKRIRENE